MSVTFDPNNLPSRGNQSLPSTQWDSRKVEQKQSEESYNCIARFFLAIRDFFLCFFACLCCIEDDEPTPPDHSYEPKQISPAGVPPLSQQIAGSTEEKKDEAAKVSSLAQRIVPSNEPAPPASAHASPQKDSFIPPNKAEVDSPKVESKSAATSAPLAATPAELPKTQTDGPKSFNPEKFEYTFDLLKRVKDHLAWKEPADHLPTRAKDGKRKHFQETFGRTLKDLANGKVIVVVDFVEKLFEGEVSDPLQINDIVIFGAEQCLLGKFPHMQEIDQLKELVTTWQRLKTIRSKHVLDQDDAAFLEKIDLSHFSDFPAIQQKFKEILSACVNKPRLTADFDWQKWIHEREINPFLESLFERIEEIQKNFAHTKQKEPLFIPNYIMDEILSQLPTLNTKVFRLWQECEQSQETLKTVEKLLELSRLTKKILTAKIREGKAEFFKQLALAVPDDDDPVYVNCKDFKRFVDTCYNLINSDTFMTYKDVSKEKGLKMKNDGSYRILARKMGWEVPKEVPIEMNTDNDAFLQNQLVAEDAVNKFNEGGAEAAASYLAYQVADISDVEIKKDKIKKILGLIDTRISDEISAHLHLILFN